MYHCGMRQMEEKHVANQVDLMVWSERLDLLALSNFKGEVQVHRIHWQRVWNLPPPKENDTVKAMAWRPDGKALAIGYLSGLICIVDIEDKEILHKFQLEHKLSNEFEDHKDVEVTSVVWLVRVGTLDDEYNVYDDSSLFLPQPSMNGYKNQNTDESNRGLKEIQDQTQLSILLVGYGAGNIHMSIFGRFPFATLNLDELLHDEFGDYRVLDMNFSDDFSIMQVLYTDKSSNSLFTALINTSVLSAYASDVFTVANKHSKVVHLLSQLDQTMTSISEAWEHILLEMDKKMSEYAASVAEGGVSADFLELLMMGVPSDELELFLLHDLTAKGLKKFGSSVELSYSTIQKLVLKQLNIVAQSIAYFLAELRGFTRIPDRFKIMGLEEIKVNEAIKASFAFLSKCLELQHVIDVSMRNYKAFFRWLFVVIVRLLDEQTPSEIVKITQQELSHIADFLYNFYDDKNSEKSSDKPTKFNLEKLGQYLQNQNLTILPEEDEDHLWHKLLKENQCLLKDNDTIYSLEEFKHFSLVQQQNFLKSAVEKVFDATEKDTSKYFSVVYNLKCFEDRSGNNPVDNLAVTQMFDADQQRFMIAYLNKSNAKDGLAFMTINVQDKECVASAGKYYFSPTLIPINTEEVTEGTCEHVPVFDLQFYSEDFLSVLVSHPQSEDSTVFVQLPLKIAVDNSNEINIKSKSCIFNDKVSRRDLSPLLDQGVVKVLEKMDGQQIAVSGGRKVAIVLAKSKRKVRVFEMEVDGEEDDDGTLDTTPHSHNTTQISDISQISPEKSCNITTDEIFE